MDSIRIRGGRPLEGEIEIFGAKNAALPLMAASLLTDETLTLSNIPHLTDITTLVHLLAQHGVEIGMDGNARRGGNAGRVLSLRARQITNTTAPYELVSRMRASILVLGPLLAARGGRPSRSPAAAPSAPAPSICISTGSPASAPRSFSKTATSARMHAGGCAGPRSGCPSLRWVRPRT